MRYLLTLLSLLIITIGLVGLTACGADGGTSSTGTFIADFELEGEEYLANPDTPLERFCMLFRSRTANALPNLGFNPNSYPWNQFTGEKNVQGGLEVIIAAPDQTFVAQGVTSTTGRVMFNSLPTGYLTMNITGADGNTYRVPIEVSENMTSRALVLVFRNPETHNVEICSKTIHDDDGNGLNDDNFSYALFGRPRNQGVGGRVHLHHGNETRIDANGDGDFLDPDDKIVVEPDDDGVPSDNGDGDEDNDGIPDNEDDDIDGDGVPNVSDNDIDGDGLANADDPYPNGITPDDDFNPPGLEGDLIYSGIMELSNIDGGASVFFPVAIDDMNDPVTYNIYYSTTTPIDFDTANLQRFRPLTPVAPDDILSDNVIGLVIGQTYYFAVRAQDSAQPPNEDDNINELFIEIQPPD